jgi:hypothetical protein
MHFVLVQELQFFVVFIFFHHLQYLPRELLTAESPLTDIIAVVKVFYIYGDPHADYNHTKNNYVIFEETCFLLLFFADATT